MIRQLLVGVAGVAVFGLGFYCALMAGPPWLGALTGGVLVIAGAAAMTWAVGA